METEPGDGDGVTAEKSPRAWQMIMMAMFKLSLRVQRKLVAETGGLNRESCSFETL